MKENIILKLKESIKSVLPISIIVALLSLLITPIGYSMLAVFFIGAILLILGTSFFTVGAEMSMSIIGERIGADIVKHKRLFGVLVLLVILGTIITIAEPDLRVLASQITALNQTLVVSVVGLGVGVLLAVAFLRVIFKIKLKYVLLFFYSLIFLIVFFVHKEFIPIAFDSGGATTGPMAVPFIIALGIGIASYRNTVDSENNSFGIVAICSIGPILAMLILGMIYKINDFEYANRIVTSYSGTSEIWMQFLDRLPQYLFEVSIAILPILLFFLIYQIFVIKMPQKELIKVVIGCIYVFIGLTMFLLGANVGFLQIASTLGEELASLNNSYFLVAVSVIMGYFIVRAEPAVIVLNKKVSDITDGAIPEKAMQRSLSIGVSIAIGLSIIRIITGIPIIYFLIVGYLVSITLAFIGSDTFTAIAFDSGGVASGTMASAFLVPFAIGIGEKVGANIMLDAFGLIAMIAMAPIITVEICGIIYMNKYKKSSKSTDVCENYNDIIEIDWM